MEEALKDKNSLPLKVTTLEADTTVVKVRYVDYKGFATCEVRTLSNILDLMKQNIPYFDDISKNQKMYIISKFEEMELQTQSVLEKEDEMPNHLYIVIKGNVNLHRRIKAINHKNEVVFGDNKLIGISDKLSKKYGPRIGSLQQKFSLACEDSVTYNQPLRYSLVSSPDCLIWRTPSWLVTKQWHPFILRLLKEGVNTKYNILLDITLGLQNILLIDEKAQTGIYNDIMVKEKTHSNFPVANSQAKQKMQNIDMLKVDLNPMSYSVTHNHLSQ